MKNKVFNTTAGEVHVKSVCTRGDYKKIQAHLVEVNNADEAEKITKMSEAQDKMVMYFIVSVAGEQAKDGFLDTLTQKEFTEIYEHVSEICGLNGDEEKKV